MTMPPQEMAIGNPGMCFLWVQTREAPNKPRYVTHGKWHGPALQAKAVFKAKVWVPGFGFQMAGCPVLLQFGLSVQRACCGKDDPLITEFLEHLWSSGYDVSLTR